MTDVTFLVTFYAQPELLLVCLDSIRKFYPIEPIIVSQEENDPVIDQPENNIVAPYHIRRIQHTMRSDGKTWVDVAIGLAEQCTTDIAVYIEHDAFLLRNIDDMLMKIKSGEYDAIGVEEMIPSEGLNRNSPGMMNQNFFIINMKKMKEMGIEKMRIDHTILRVPMKNAESGYGISQSLENKLFLPVTSSGYAYGTYYGDVAHHLWYGSYRKRDVMFDNVNPMWMDHEANRLIADYWEGKIK
jgi:hypothetical protein